jgi:hypothetical protein
VIRREVMHKFPNGHWHTKANVQAVVAEAMADNHGLIPGYKWFRLHGYAGMINSLQLQGITMADLRKQYGVDEVKYCKSCGQTLPFSQFRVRTKKRGDHLETFRNDICTPCNQKQSQGYRETWPGRAAEAYRRCRGRAHEQGLEFNLTKEWIADRLEAIDWKCEETRIPFEQGKLNAFNSIYTMSVDRIDSTRGYTTDNVRFVINWVNIAKQHLSNDQFVKLCMKVADAHR